MIIDTNYLQNKTKQKKRKQNGDVFANKQTKL